MKSLEGQELIDRRKVTAAHRVAVRWKVAIEALAKVGLSRAAGLHLVNARARAEEDPAELDRAFTMARSELRGLRNKAIDEGADAQTTGAIQTATDALGALWVIS